jgi:hypothetical protein
MREKNAKVREKFFRALSRSSFRAFSRLKNKNQHAKFYFTCFAVVYFYSCFPADNTT